MNYIKIDFEDYQQTATLRLVKNDDSVIVTFYNNTSSGDPYTASNVPDEYDNARLEDLFKVMYRNQTQHAYSYETFERDSSYDDIETLEEIEREYENIYKVFYLSTDRNKEAEILPYEWCIVKSDDKLTENELMHHTIRYFKRAKNRVDNGRAHFGYQLIK